MLFVHLLKLWATVGPMSRCTLLVYGSSGQGCWTRRYHKVVCSNSRRDASLGKLLTCPLYQSSAWTEDLLSYCWVKALPHSDLLPCTRLRKSSIKEKCPQQWRPQWTRMYCRGYFIIISVIIIYCNCIVVTRSRLSQCRITDQLVTLTRQLTLKIGKAFSNSLHLWFCIRIPITVVIGLPTLFQNTGDPTIVFVVQINNMITLITILFVLTVLGNFVQTSQVLCD